ncbi:uncharacterized protein TNCV_3007211 [Trichonephila clavipes]|nr:uncharacterized protein TNCV_3007211 [Trichonephila clavipes]
MTFMFVVVGSHFVGCGGEPGMIHLDAHHLRITAITGNRGIGEFDKHWIPLVIKHVGMSKINGLQGALSEKEGQLALYMLEERDVRGHPMGQSILMRAFHMCIQSPFSRLGTHYTPR